MIGIVGRRARPVRQLRPLFRHHHVRQQQVDRPEYAADPQGIAAMLRFQDRVALRPENIAGKVRTACSSSTRRMVRDQAGSGRHGRAAEKLTALARQVDLERRATSRFTVDRCVRRSLTIP
jgi:hypothetical protein